MTIGYSQHDEKEDEKKEESSGSEIHDGSGEADGDTTEVSHCSQESSIICIICSVLFVENLMIRGLCSIHG